jgi:hypothetical protein
MPDEAQVDDDDGSIVEFSAADLGRPIYEGVSARPAKVFQPWHRPRKHYVRKFQWLRCVQDIYQDRDPADRVTFLGLPGSDLLFLRLLHSAICEPQNRTLRFLGFHSGATPGSSEAITLAVSVQQLKLRALVHEDSQVLPDDIRKLGSRESMASQEARKFAPFDVINIDLCASIAADKPLSVNSLYTTINRLVGMQRTTRQWLLLVTSRFDRQTLDKEAAARLLTEVIRARECDGFDAACLECFEQDITELELEKCSERDYFRLMAVGFCQWVFRIAQEHSPQYVKVRMAYCYQVLPSSAGPDMMSMAIRFTPVYVAAEDPSGLAQADTPAVDDCEAAVDFVKKVSGAKDVDYRLGEKLEMRMGLMEEQGRLLEEAGYDYDEYIAWAEGFPS